MCNRINIKGNLNRDQDQEQREGDKETQYITVLFKEELQRMTTTTNINNNHHELGYKAQLYNN